MHTANAAVAAPCLPVILTALGQWTACDTVKDSCSLYNNYEVGKISKKFQQFRPVVSASEQWIKTTHMCKSESARLFAKLLILHMYKKSKSRNCTKCYGTWRLEIDVKYNKLRLP